MILICNGNSRRGNVCLPSSTIDAVLLEENNQYKLVILNGATLLFTQLIAEDLSRHDLSLAISAQSYLFKPFEPFEGLSISQIYSSHGTLLALSSDGRIFAYGHSQFGQCGVISDFV